MMYQIENGKVIFVDESIVHEYSCNCKHDMDIWDDYMYEFLEHHMIANHVTKYGLSCPRCGNIIFNHEKKMGSTVECVECEVMQFMAPAYINVFIQKVS